MKCIICDWRPAIDKGYCAQCAGKLAKKRRCESEPRYFLTYRGHVIGLYPNGDKTLKPQLLMCSAEYLPKGKTIDLNHYCEGYTRKVIKRFKACVQGLAQA